MSLCRLSRGKDTRIQAIRILTESYDWFTKGFTTARFDRLQAFAQKAIMRPA
jgi:hypothetical protein